MARKKTARLERLKARTLAATVRLANLGGQGVLVPGGYILTAAHCVEWGGGGGMATGGLYIEKIKTRCGREFLAQVIAADPVADIAALAPMDAECGELASRSVEAFEQFGETVEAVPLFTRTLGVDEPLPIHVLTHMGRWITGRAVYYGMPWAVGYDRLCLEADSRIRGGTSGGPVINEAGELVGLVSHSSETPSMGCFSGLMPAPWMALPRWLADSIVAGGNARLAS
jgi:S1-C subfamily serine protease